MRRLLAVAAAAASIALLLAGCASTTASAEPGAGKTVADAPGSTALSGDLSVSAAASLKDAFDEAVTQFTAAHPDVHITVSYDGSSTLATQIVGGAPVDVFASADQANMAKVTDAGLATGAVVFARNTLVIVVPRANPGDVHTLADLADPTLKVVLCAPQVPCGTASQQLLANAGVAVTPASLEQNVTAVLTKVRTGEADAGLVYTTDARTTDAVTAIDPPGAGKVVNSYPIVALKDAPHPAAAAAFVDFITGPQGQQILASFGFRRP
ncbi:molybdate ABC transporter substrate-binding protein [Microbacterium kribbense]|uniref:Molybdate ABC transporter substrate-binding protein n=1 Tax=Microbacterium kribbense TaxID=433645 RepID=A0ABP7GHV5_9MICO